MFEQKKKIKKRVKRDKEVCCVGGKLLEFGACLIGLCLSVTLDGLSDSELLLLISQISQLTLVFC